MIKKISIILGALFIIIGFLPLISNPLIGNYGFFFTNYLHDFLHILLGVFLLIVAFVFSHKSFLALNIVTFVALGISILGAVFIPKGGIFFGIGMSMSDHILHLLFGIFLIVLISFIKRKEDIFV